MSDSNQSTARALGAVDDASELLGLAERAVERARAECTADALGVAERLKQQIQFLRKVARLLRHEIERPQDAAQPALNPPESALDPASLDERSATL